jgi:predicted anti-sigma-YlaC factor YlaD
MVTCQKLVELLTDYLEGDLSPEDKAHLDQHLGFCPPCEAYLDQMRRLGPMARRCIADKGMPVSVAARLEDFLRSKCGGKKSC